MTSASAGLTRKLALTHVGLCMLIAACNAPAAPPAAPIASSTAVPSAAARIPTPIQLDPIDRWIEVDLEYPLVRLHEGQQVIATYAAATGVPGDPATATPPGVYFAVEMEKGPIENVPGVFVADIVLFDRLNGVGLHSVPMDASGTVLDSRLGQPISAGCVRVENSAAVFEFAKIGMWAHKLVRRAVGPPHCGRSGCRWVGKSPTRQAPAASGPIEGRSLRSLTWRRRPATRAPKPGAPLSRGAHSDA